MINLLPPEIKDNTKFGRYNVTAIQYAFLVILVSVSLVAVLLFGMQVVSNDEDSLKAIIQEKEQVLTQLEPKVNEAKDLDKSIDTIGALLKREVSFSDLLRDIGGIIPNGAVLTGLSLTGDASDPLQIDAKVNTQELSAVLQENLEKSDLFEGADIQSIAGGDLNENEDPINYRVRIVVNFQSGATP